MRTKAEDALIKNALQILRRETAAGAKCWPQTEPGLAPILEMLRVEYAHKPREHCGMILLDHHARLLGVECVTIGGSTSVALHARELVATALRYNANGALLWHTHPGGDHKPSDADIEGTLGLIKLFRALEVEIHDHFVLSTEGHTSIRDYTANGGKKS